MSKAKVARSEAPEKSSPASTIRSVKMRESGRKIRDLPGWEEAKVKAAERTRYDGSKYRGAIGVQLQVIGAMVVPPSVDHVSTELVKALIVGLNRQNWQKCIREQHARQEAEKVVPLEGARLRLELRRMERRRLAGDFSDACRDGYGFAPFEGGSR